MPLSVLYLGGTGVISSACVRASLAIGHEVHVLVRGTAGSRALPPGVIEHRGDMRDEESVRRALGGRAFDVVADFIAFAPTHVTTALELFGSNAGQYVFISSTSAYQKPAAILPIRESTPLRNPYFPYSRDKIACEDVLVHEYRASGAPVTIVRPSYTYDETLFPMDSGWTVVERMREGRPILLPDGGRPLCTLTHADDFAATFVRLLGDPRTHGESFHITGEEAISWRQAFDAVAIAAGAVADYVSVPSEEIAVVDGGWGEILLGDRAHSSIFDNSKVRSLVPQHAAKVAFAEGARRIVDWHERTPSAQVRDVDRERLMDELIARRRGG
jgi:nucleoside-diphosphate-sugar epimerase